jgi:hypothetical protein
MVRCCYSHQVLWRIHKASSDDLFTFKLTMIQATS